jgi:hypothetical protein
MKERSTDSSVGIANDYGLNGPGSIPGSAFFFLYSIQTDSGAHPASYAFVYRE